MTTAPEISVVLPVLNEQESLERLDRELRQALQSTDRRAEILYVDDASTDGSSEILSRLAASAKSTAIRTRVITLRRNFGQTASLAAGIDLAEGEIVVPLDSDGQNNPADIPRLVKTLEEGFDVVSGWRRSRKDRLISKRVPSMLANWLISKLVRLPLHDYGCTLKAYRADLLQEVRLYGDMHRFIPVFLAAKGARVTEIVVDHRPRYGGSSKYGLERVLKVVSDLLHIYFISRFYTRPMHFFGLLGVILLLATVLVGFLGVALHFGWLSFLGPGYRASLFSTPLPSISAILFVGSMVSLLFGLLAEILIRIHHEARGFRPYAIREIADSHRETGPASRSKAYPAGRPA